MNALMPIPGHIDPVPVPRKADAAARPDGRVDLVGLSKDQLRDALATAGMAALLPQALLGPLGGTLADRSSRRLLMTLADTVSALCMLVLIALFASGRVELWHVYTMMFVRSSMQAFQGPAAAASTAAAASASSP